jgi:hypothetical protein
LYEPISARGVRDCELWKPRARLREAAPELLHASAEWVRLGTYEGRPPGRRVIRPPRVGHTGRSRKGANVRSDVSRRPDQTPI